MGRTRWAGTGRLCKSGGRSLGGARTREAEYDGLVRQVTAAWRAVEADAIQCSRAIHWMAKEATALVRFEQSCADLYSHAI